MSAIIRPGKDSQYGGCAHVFVDVDGIERHVATFYAPRVNQAMVLAQYHIDTMGDIESIVQRAMEFNSAMDKVA